MSSVKIQVVTRANWRVDVLVDGKFIYESSYHKSVEMKHLKKLIEALQLDNVEIIDSESDDQTI